MKIEASIPPEYIEAIAQRAAEIVLERQSSSGGDVGELLTVEEAAAYLRCKPQRIYDLRTSRRLPSTSEGGRAIVRRGDLDRLVQDADALSPALERRRLRTA